MIKSFFAVFIGLVYLGSALVADAHTARQVTIDPIAPLSFATFPQEYGVTGFIEHNPVDSLQNLTLFVNGEAVALVEFPFLTTPGATTTYTLPWQITAPGTYTLQTKVRHGYTGIVSSSTVQTVVVSQTVVDDPEEPEEPPVVTTCAAAPAVAAAYLKSLSEKPKGKEQANIVSAVARYMGPQIDFDGVAACDNEYAAVVQGFVDDMRVQPAL